MSRFRINKLRCAAEMRASLNADVRRHDCGIGQVASSECTLAIGAALLPFVAMAGYLVVTRGLLDSVSPTGDYVAAFASIGLRCRCLGFLHLSVLARVALAIPYARCSSRCEIYFSLSFVCAVYENCL